MGKKKLNDNIFRALTAFQLTVVDGRTILTINTNFADKLDKTETLRAKIKLPHLESVKWVLA